MTLKLDSFSCGVKVSQFVILRAWPSFVIMIGPSSSSFIDSPSFNDLISSGLEVACGNNGISVSIFSSLGETSVVIDADAVDADDDVVDVDVVDDDGTGVDDDARQKLILLPLKLYFLLLTNRIIRLINLNIDTILLKYQKTLRWLYNVR